MSANKAGLPGGGPWRILPECPARLHNTGHASVKGAQIDGRGPRVMCTCPHGLARRAEIFSVKYRHDQERAHVAREVTKRAPIVRKGRVSVPQYVSNMTGDEPPPDLSAGLCHTPAGVMIMDQAADRRWTGDALHVARALCDGSSATPVCPVRAQCLAWAQKREQPAGAWVGIYGGYTHIERRKMKGRAA